MAHLTVVPDRPDNDADRRVALALSILVHATPPTLKRARREAVDALKGASIDELLASRTAEED